MGCEWREGALEQLAAPEKGSIAIGPFGSRMKADCYVEKGVALIRGTNLGHGKSLSGEFVFITSEKAAELGNANLKPGDLVFPHRGAIGEVGIVPDDGRRYALSTSLMKITLDCRRAIPDFYYYFFKSTKGQSELLKNASQVGTPGIATPLKSLRECVVTSPSLSEQAGVVAVLRCLDDRIDLLRQTNATLEAIAQALFKSWFVDFDPVHAKAEGREPEAMDAATAALFPSEFEESELGLIPKGWCAGKLGDMAKLRGGKQLSRDLFTEDGQFPVFGGAGEMGRTNVLNAEGLVVTVGRVGAYCGQFFLHSGAAWVNNNASHVIPHAEYLASTLWIFLALKNSDIDPIKKGAAQPFVSNSDIEGLPLAIPDHACIGAFIRLASPIFEGASQANEHARSLAEFRDTLLPRLISGKLRVTEIAEATEESAA